MSPAHVLAFDYGASGGRAIAGSYDGRRIVLEELHRFSNDPVTLNGTIYWDVLRLFHEMKQGLAAARSREVSCIGIDTWGVDFALLDAGGGLLGNPVHYRDGRTVGMVDAALARMDAAQLYRHTGTQIMEMNTAFQLLSLRLNQPDVLARAGGLLMMPDFFRYCLTGARTTERSIASTTQLMDIHTGTWSRQVLDALELPPKLLPPVETPGRIAGLLSDGLCRELGLPQVPVAAVPGHDTQCAQAAVPAAEPEFLFMSCGTWCLLGTELPEPVVRERARRMNLTNEAGFGGAYALMQNLTGLWLLQESRRQWRREGFSYTYDEIEQLAREAEPFRCFIEPGDGRFAAMGDLPGRVREFCTRSGQPVPDTVGAVARCLYESLALSFRRAKGQVEAAAGRRYDTLYLVGGGIQDALLCQMAADACGCRVVAGPKEATALGNAAIQLCALGVLDGLESVRETVRNSVKTKEYLPDSDGWAEAYARFEGLAGSNL